MPSSVFGPGDRACKGKSIFLAGLASAVVASLANSPRYTILVFSLIFFVSTAISSLKRCLIRNAVRGALPFPCPRVPSAWLRHEIQSRGLPNPSGKLCFRSSRGAWRAPRSVVTRKCRKQIARRRFALAAIKIRQNRRKTVIGLDDGGRSRSALATMAKAMATAVLRVYFPINLS